jgi:multiple sugar transport system substrate-binding protein
MTFRRVALALSGAAALIAAGCGGGGSTTGSGGSTPSGTSAAAQNAPACTPAKPGEKVTLSFVAWTPGYDKVVDLWNERNPDIQVKYKAVTPGQEGGYQNYFNQIQAGTTPDMGFVEYSPLPGYRVQDGLYDLAGCPGIAEARDLFVPWTMQQMTLGTDAVYGLPHDVSPMGAYWRTDLFKQAGIAIPKTWGEYYEAAKKVRAAGGYIGNLPPDWADELAGLVDQAGAQWFANSGSAWKVSLDDAPSKKVVAFWQKMLDEKLLTNYPSFGDEMNNAFQSDKLWGLVAASWTSSFIRSGAPKTAGKWGVTLLPQWEAGAKDSGSWGGGGIVAFKNTKHPAEAAKFIKWILTNPEALALNNKQAGVYPATKTALQDVPSLQKPDPFFGGEKIWNVFDESARDLKYNWLWGPTMVATNAAIGDGVTAAIQGRGTLEQALASAQSKTVAAMQAQSIEVAP